NRTRVSAKPPGAYGTIRVMGLDGQPAVSWAWAGRLAARAVAASTLARSGRNARMRGTPVDVARFAAIMPVRAVARAGRPAGLGPRGRRDPTSPAPGGAPGADPRGADAWPVELALRRVVDMAQAGVEDPAVVQLVVHADLPRQA